jgi:tRNA acetyltransferase TAN1
MISTYRFKEEEAQDEILELLESFGDSNATCQITEISGMLVALTSMDPVAVIGKLKETASSEPWQIRYVLRVLPIMITVQTGLHEIALAAVELGSRIRLNETFRVTVEKRHTSLQSGQVIDAVASKIQNKVDLENPDWIILVQILGAWTGVSVVRPDWIFSSVIEKRA